MSSISLREAIDGAADLRNLVDIPAVCLHRLKQRGNNATTKMTQLPTPLTVVG